MVFKKNQKTNHVARISPDTSLVLAASFTTEQIIVDSPLFLKYL